MSGESQERKTGGQADVRTSTAAHIHNQSTEEAEVEGREREGLHRGTL